MKISVFSSVFPLFFLSLPPPHTLTSQLWDDGVRSSYFLLVKMSMATKWHLAWPCLPVKRREEGWVGGGRVVGSAAPPLLRAPSVPTSAHSQRWHPVRHFPHRRVPRSGVWGQEPGRTSARGSARCPLRSAKKTRSLLSLLSFRPRRRPRTAAARHYFNHHAHPSWTSTRRPPCTGGP